jgi:prepilin-type N-terminal cleavage/methylation domain-containing protein
MNRIDKMCGFTLIEIILAIAVVAIALTGLIGAISFVTKQNVQTEIQTTATELAQERMEQLIAEKAKNGLNSSPALDVTASPSYVPISGFSGYEQQTEICYADIPSSDPTQCWAVGEAPSTILKYDGSSWSSVSSPTSYGLTGVYCVSTNDCWAVGGTEGVAAVTVHYNGSAWSTVSSPVANELHTIDCLASNDCWSTGHAGTIFHWNGSTWTQVSSPLSNDIEALDCVASNDCWAGENPEILHYNGSSWSNWGIPPGTGNPQSGAYCNNASDCWMVGWFGGIKRWNGTTWLNFVDDVGPNLEMVGCAASNDCWAVGGADAGPGKAARFNGSTWTVLSPDPSPNQLKFVDCEAPDNCRAVGRAGTILRWNGTSWSSETSGTTSILWAAYCWVGSSGATVTKTSPCNSGGTAGYKYVTVTVRQNGLSSPITSVVTTLMSDY